MRIGRIKNCVLQDRVKDQQIIDILKDQIVYLRNEINHKNTVIKSLLNHSHNNGENIEDICTDSSGSIMDCDDNANDYIIPKLNNNNSSTMIIILHPDVTSINYLTNLPWSSKILILGLLMNVILPLDVRNIKHLPNLLELSRKLWP